MKARNWSLDFKNPNGAAAAIHKTPAKLLDEIEDVEEQIRTCINEIKQAL